MNLNCGTTAKRWKKKAGTKAHKVTVRDTTNSDESLRKPSILPPLEINILHMDLNVK